MGLRKTDIKRYFQDRTNIVIFVLLVLVTIYGAVVRFDNLSVLAYWGDDGHTFVGTMGLIEHGIPRYPSGYIMYHTIASFYLRAIPALIFGLGEFALRFPSALFGTLAIPLVFVFVKEFTNKYAAIIAAAITSFNFWQIAFSRETRYYSEFQFFYLLSVYLFYRGFFKDEKKYKIMAMVCIFFTILIQQMGFTLLFLFIPLLIYKGKSFFRKDVLICLGLVIAFIAGNMIHRELVWKIGLSFYSSSETAQIANPFLRTIAKYYSGFSAFHLKIFAEMFERVYYLFIYGLLLIPLYMFVPQARSRDEHFRDIYTGRRYSVKLPFNIFFIYFIFFANIAFIGLGDMNLQQRYIYFMHPLFISAYVYVAFEIARLLVKGISFFFGRLKERKKRLFLYARYLLYLLIAVLILLFTVTWSNPVSNHSIVKTKNGDPVNPLFAVSNTFNFHHDPKSPGLYIANNKSDDDIVIATDVLNPYGYTRQLDYWLWTGGGFKAWQPYIFKDGKVYDEYFAKPIITDIYELFKVLNENYDKDIWIITSNSIRVPNHISPDVAEFILEDLEAYRAITGMGGVCSAYYIPGVDDKAKRDFFFRADDESILTIPDTGEYLFDFSQAENKRYLEYGWAEVEPYGTWADRKYSVIFLEFEKVADYRLGLKMMPLQTGEDPQEVTVLFNGTELGTLELEEDFQEYYLDLPSSLIDKGEPNILEFNYKNLLSPADLGMSSDTRRLAVYFDFIKTIMK